MLVRTAIETEVSGYEAALAAAHVEVTQMGLGVGPNALREVVYENLHVASGSVGFPVVGRATLGDDVVALALIVRSSLGSQWSGNEVRPGMLLAYGSRAEHYAVSNPGLEYRWALLDRDVVEATADALRRRVRLPVNGASLLLPTAPNTSDIRNLLWRVGAPTSNDPALPHSEDEVLEALVSAFAGARSGTRPPPRTTINNRQLVSACIDFSDETGRIPSLSELCRAFSVSERRLRTAFYDSCGTGPNAFLRARLLGLARRRLLAPDAPTVTTVANDLGFRHLGRFARHYATLFGEMPHQTARAGSIQHRDQIWHGEPASDRVA